MTTTVTTEEVQSVLSPLMEIATDEIEQSLIRGIIETTIDEDLSFAIKPGSTQWITLLGYCDRVRRVAQLLVKKGVKWPLVNNELEMPASAVLADIGIVFIEPTRNGKVLFVGHGQMTSQLLVMPSFRRILTLHEAMENPDQEFKYCRVEDEPTYFYDAAVIATCHIRASTQFGIPLNPSRYDAVKRVIAMLQSIGYKTADRFASLINMTGLNPASAIAF